MSHHYIHMWLLENDYKHQLLYIYFKNYSW